MTQSTTASASPRFAVACNGTCTLYAPGKAIWAWAAKQVHTVRVRSARGVWVVTYIREGHKRKEEVRIPKGKGGMVILRGRQFKLQQAQGARGPGAMATTKGRYLFQDPRWARDFYRKLDAAPSGGYDVLFDARQEE